MAAANDCSSNRPGPCTTGSVPASSDRATTCNPAMWVIGSASTHWPGPPRANSVPATEARSAAADSSTSFGVPVDPLVGTSNAVSSNGSSPCATASNAAASGASAGSGSTGSPPSNAERRPDRTSSSDAVVASIVTLFKPETSVVVGIT